MREDLSLDIFNNTNSTIPISILNNSIANNGIINQTTQYSFLVAALPPTETQVRMQYRVTATSVWQWTNAATIANPTQPQSLADALNTLNIATFYTYTVGINTYFATYNDNYEIGLITTYAPNDAVINYTWQTLDTGGDNSIDLNLVNQVLDANPITSSFKVTPIVGDSILFSGTTSTWALNNAGGYTLVQILELNSGLVVNTQLADSVPFSHTYTASAGSFYVFSVYDLI